MATRTVQLFNDDLDGSDADETVVFSLDGTRYEIDLSDANAAALRKLFDPLTSVSRRMGRDGTKSTKHDGGTAHIRTIVKAINTPKIGGSGLTRAERDEIRDWADAQGIQVGDRGRIKQEIVDAYRNRETLAAAAAAAKVEADKQADRKAREEAAQAAIEAADDAKANGGDPQSEIPKPRTRRRAVPKAEFTPAGS